MITMWDANPKIDFCPGGTQDPLPVADRCNADSDERSVDCGNSATELHLNTVRVVGHDDWPGEPDSVGDHPAGVTYPIGNYSKRRSHGEHPVGDDAWKADPLREVLRVMDGIEIG